MPNVRGKSFPYTKAGIAAANKAKKKKPTKRKPYGPKGKIGRR